MTDLIKPNELSTEEQIIKPNETSPIEKQIIKDEETKLINEVIQPDQRIEIIRQINDILKEYNWLESNVPLNSRYWTLLNEYRSLGGK